MGKFDDNPYMFNSNELTPGYSEYNGNYKVGYKNIKLETKIDTMPILVNKNIDNSVKSAYEFPDDEIIEKNLPSNKRNDLPIRPDMFTSPDYSPLSLSLLLASLSLLKKHTN